MRWTFIEDVVEDDMRTPAEADFAADLYSSPYLGLHTESASYGHSHCLWARSGLCHLILEIWRLLVLTGLFYLESTHHVPGSTGRGEKNCFLSTYLSFFGWGPLNWTNKDRSIGEKQTEFY